MNPNPEVVKLLNQQHEEWLKHPVTREMFKVLSKHREALIEKVSAKVHADTTSDSAIRRELVNISAVDFVNTILSNTESFVRLATKQ